MIDIFGHHLLRLAIVEGAARLAHLLLVPAGSRGSADAAANNSARIR
jgi:hypothetical protein